MPTRTTELLVEEKEPILKLALDHNSRDLWVATTSSTGLLPSPPSSSPFNPPSLASTRPLPSPPSSSPSKPPSPASPDPLPSFSDIEKSLPCSLLCFQNASHGYASGPYGSSCPFPSGSKARVHLLPLGHSLHNPTRLPSTTLITFPHEFLSELSLMRSCHMPLLLPQAAVTHAAESTSAIRSVCLGFGRS